MNITVRLRQHRARLMAGSPAAFKHCTVTEQVRSGFAELERAFGDHASSDKVILPAGKVLGGASLDGSTEPGVLLSNTIIVHRSVSWT